MEARKTKASRARRRLARLHFYARGSRAFPAHSETSVTSPVTWCRDCFRASTLPCLRRPLVQLTYGDEGVLLGFPHEFFLERLLPGSRQREALDRRRLREVERHGGRRRDFVSLLRGHLRGCGRHVYLRLRGRVSELLDPVAL